MILTGHPFRSPAAEFEIGSMAPIGTLLLLYILSSFLLHRHGLTFSSLFFSV